MVALQGQRVKRFIPIELTLYLPTPDTRRTVPPLSDTATIGARIKYYRLQKGLTQEQLARSCGTSRAHIIDLEKNKISNTKPQAIQDIANALQISPLKLVTSTNRNNKGGNFIDYIIPPVSLGARIKNLRLKKGITQKELVRRTKLSKDCIWRYEKNIAKPNRNILMKIARSLNVGLTELAHIKPARRKIKCE